MMNAQETSLPADADLPSAREGEKEMTPASLEGHTLGKYRVLESLGRGGMARVYRAYHPQLDRYVAIKALRSDLVEDEEFLARFRREAQAVAALRHPNIVQVFDFDVQDDIYYMVLELLEGDTLKTRLNDYRARSTRVPLGDMVRILLDVLDGLAYAHGEGMIHRDIKSANILLTKRGQAVIADFGIAQIVGSTRHTASGALMGTLNYMAPEQGLKGQSDTRSDIYSLGIVLYEMLTQRTPFDADTPLAILMKHLNDPLPLPRQIDPTIPEPFERVVFKALAKQPEGRYQSAEEMAQALRDAADEAGIELPERISSPFCFATAEAPSESVAVFSGTTRERITDRHFADDDTDATLGQKLAAERAAGEQAGESVGRELLDALGALGRLVVGRTAQALRDAVEAASEGEPPEPPPGPGGISFAVSPRDEMPDETAEAESAVEDAGVLLDGQIATGDAIETAESTAGEMCRAEGERPPGALAKPILSAVAVLAIGNLTMVWLGGITGQWEIYSRGWPVELFLVSLGLCLIMVDTATMWLLIPVGILLGNGILFSISALTSWWELWACAWPLEPLLIGGTIFWTIRQARRGARSRHLSRSLGRLLTQVCIALSLVVGGLGLLAGLLSQ
jgi:serine/threonine protein kinase